MSIALCPTCGGTDCEHQSADTPPIGDVLDRAAEENAIPVRVVNTVEVDQLPHRGGVLINFLIPAASRAVKLLGRDPRRGGITIGVFNGSAVIAGTQAEAQSFKGYLIPLGFDQFHVPFNWQDELWCRPTTPDVTGTNIVFNASADMTCVSLMVQQWSR